MTETPAYTHRFVFDGHLPTMGDTRSLSANWQKIEAAFDALEKIVKDAGGTLACVPVRNGEKKGKTIPAAPPSQSAHVIGDPGPVTGLSGGGPAPLSGGAEKHPAPEGATLPPHTGHKPPLRGAGDKEAA